MQPSCLDEKTTMHQAKRAHVAIAASPDILARLIERHAPRAGDHPTAIPSLSLHRRHAPTDPMPCIYPLSLVLTAQGDKQVMMGDEILEYTPGQSMLATVELPVISHVTRATVHRPYLGLLLRLDAQKIAELAAEMELPPLASDHDRIPISIETLEPALLDALCRLVELLDDPGIMRNLAPLIEQEIVIRLLRGPHGPHLRQLITEESPGRQIARVVTWMKQNFVETFNMDDIAAKANMSLSTFRKHFHTITGMSPLQYQKQLRLQEARRLMLNQGMDAGRASGLVGYQSASQFSREYSRVFGAPPRRDIQRMRVRNGRAQALPS